MKTIQQQYGREIWKLILQAVADHCENDIDTRDLKPISQTNELFSPNTSSGKNRLGSVMFDLFENINKLCHTELEIDYPPRSEFHNFPQLQYIWIYFINRLESESSSKVRVHPIKKIESEQEGKLGKIISFPLKK
jgi:hypothetical protein